MDHWYVVRTKAKQEVTAQRNLDRQGYQIFLPIAHGKKLFKKQYRYFTEPLFPGYIFIRLNLDRDNPGPIRSTLGVMGLVRFGDYMPPVPSKLIELIQRQANQTSGFIEFEQPEWQPGDKLVVLDGPFEGLQVMFQSRNSKDRVRVLLDILGQHKVIEIPNNLLAIA